MESLKEKLEKIDAYTFRNEWKAKLEQARSDYYKSNEDILKLLSTLYEKRNVISFEYVQGLNNRISENLIKIDELSAILLAL